MATRSFHRTFGTAGMDLAGRFVFDVINDQWANDLREFSSESSSKNDPATPPSVSSVIRRARRCW